MTAKKPTPQRRLEVAFIDGYFLTRLAYNRWQESVKGGLEEKHFTFADTRAAFQKVKTLFVDNPEWKDYRKIDHLRIDDAVSVIDKSEIDQLISDRPGNAVQTMETITRLVEAEKKRCIVEGLKTAIKGAESSGDAETALLLAKQTLDRLGASIPTTETPTATVNASEWLKEADEPEQPILQGLFDHGDRVAIVGQSKARKSFYALQLAVAVATGTEFLGVPTVKQNVLLVNGEIIGRAYKKRLRRMVAKLGIDPATLDGLVIVNASENADVGGFAEILTLCKKQGAAVAVIDPAYLLLGDEIDQQQVKQSVRDMKLFSADGVTLVCVYHATKGRMGDKQTVDRISGSGIFARDASTMLTLCEHASEPDHVVVQAITRNYAPCEPMTVVFDEGAFILTDVAPVEKTSTTKAARVIPTDDVAGCFNSVKVNYADAVKAVQLRLGVGVGKAKELIKRAVSDGLVKTEKDWRTTLYFNKGTS